MPENREKIIHVRMSDAGYEWVDTAAAEYRLSKADIIREALALAATQPAAFAVRLAERSKF